LEISSSPVAPLMVFHLTWLITKDLYPHLHDYFPSLSQHSQIPLIKHHLHLACLEACEQKFKIIHFSACTSAHTWCVHLPCHVIIQMTSVITKVNRETS
jgi:hypothetical protein